MLWLESKTKEVAVSYSPYLFVFWYFIYLLTFLFFFLFGLIQLLLPFSFDYYKFYSGSRFIIFFFKMK